MEIKIVKTSSDDYQILYKNYLKEMTIDKYYELNKSFYDKNPDKQAIIFYKNNVPLAFISYKYDIFNLIVSHMYVDPTIRGIGIEESIIKALENSYNKIISIILKNNDSYSINLLKTLGYYRSSVKSLGSLKKYYDIYTKDNNYRYTKIIINLSTLYDKNSKLECAVKRILKLYGIKPRKETIRAYMNNILQIDEKKRLGELSEEEHFKQRFQKYMNQYDVKIDPTLCYRMYNSSSVKLNPYAKKFLSKAGKHKHIFIISDMKPLDLEDMIKTLKLKNISNVYNMPISMTSIKKIINNNKYRNIMEYVYVDSSKMDDDVLRIGIDTILVSKDMNTNNSFYFKKHAFDFKELTQIILKK